MLINDVLSNNLFTGGALRAVFVATKRIQKKSKKGRKMEPAPVADWEPPIKITMAPAPYL